MDPMIVALIFFMFLGMGIVGAIYAFLNQGDKDWFSFFN